MVIYGYNHKTKNKQIKQIQYLVAHDIFTCGAVTLHVSGLQTQYSQSEIFQISPLYLTGVSALQTPVFGTHSG